MAKHPAGDEVRYSGGAGEDEERCDGIVKGGRHGGQDGQLKKKKKKKEKKMGAAARSRDLEKGGWELGADRVANEKMRNER